VFRPHITDGSLQGAKQEVVNLTLLPEAHLMLGGVHVHIDGIGGQIEEEHKGRVAAVIEHVAIGLANGMGDHPILHRATIHKEVLQIGLAPGKGWLGHPAMKPKAITLPIERKGRPKERIAADRAHPLKLPIGGDGGKGPGALTIGPEGEGHGGIGQREAPKHLFKTRAFRSFGSQELTPGRRIEKEVFHVNGRAFRMRCGKALRVVC
jgi:hypothetical protein